MLCPQHSRLQVLPVAFNKVRFDVRRRFGNVLILPVDYQDGFTLGRVMLNQRQNVAKVPAFARTYEAFHARSAIKPFRHRIQIFLAILATFRGRTATVATRPRIARTILRQFVVLLFEL